MSADFEQMWAQLRPIGLDRRTGGYHRSAWTTVDAELRAWFATQAEARGMALQIDRNGNQWAWWGEPAQGAVITGSHLDSVPDGGAFDGPLGVVSAFAALDRLRSEHAEPTKPLAITNFVDEEGARFGVACVGSRLLTGALDGHRAAMLADASGTTLADAMESAGHDPAAIGVDDALIAHAACFVELHVEQGRHLDQLDVPVGVATAIWPHGRWRIDFAGESNHAGTTPMVDRRDPMIACAATILAARNAGLANDALATIGRVLTRPGGTNVIASVVSAWLDARGPDDEHLTAVMDEIEAAAIVAAANAGVTVSITQESLAPMVQFDEALAAHVTELLGDVPMLPTGAGHDAGVLSSRIPAAMLFVRNPTGVSHSPAESARIDDCLAGVDALATVLGGLLFP